MSGSSEREWVRAFERWFGGPAARRAALVGIGDDAAVLAAGREKLVFTVDASVENVHFRREWLSPGDIGARAFHAAVSDIAAMGARPVAALSSVVVPRSMSDADFRALAKGQAVAARELACPVVGGNLSRGGELSVTTSVVGRAARPLLRSGARPGDELWLVGSVGLARAGLLFLSRDRGAVRRSRKASCVAECVNAWRRPRALVRDGMRLVGRAHAAIDLSDGLSTDAAHLAEASRVRVVIDEAALRAALPGALVAAAKLFHADALELALAGGEDYALLATGPRARRPRGARRIGFVEKGQGLYLASSKGDRPLESTGFDHFR